MWGRGRQFWGGKLPVRFLADLHRKRPKHGPYNDAPLLKCALKNGMAITRRCMSLTEHFIMPPAQ